MIPKTVFVHKVLEKSPTKGHCTVARMTDWQPALSLVHFPIQTMKGKLAHTLKPKVFNTRSNSLKHFHDQCEIRDDDALPHFQNTALQGILLTNRLHCSAKGHYIK